MLLRLIKSGIFVHQINSIIQAPLYFINVISDYYNLYFSTKVYRYAYFIISLIVSSNIYSQPKTILFDNYNTSHGLSNNEITSIMKDSKHYIWISTVYGLNRFDGKVFKNFYKNPKDPKSLIDNKVKTCKEDHEGNIWIGTRTGICIYNPKKDQFEKIDLPNESERSIRSKEIFSFWQDAITKDMHIATNQGIYYYSYQTKKIIAYKDTYQNKFLSNISVRCMLSIDDHMMWIGTMEGIVIYNFCDSTYHRIYTDLKSNEAFTDNMVQDIYRDRRGTIWLATWGSGIRRWNDRDSSFTDFIQDTSQYKVPVANISLKISETNFPGEEDLLWIACDNPSFACLNVKTEVFTNYYSHAEKSNFLIEGNTRTLYFDKEDGLWIGGQLGVWKYDFKKQLFDLRQFYQCMNSKKLLQVTTVCEDKSSPDTHLMYIGTWNDGPFVYDFINNNCLSLTKKYNLPIKNEDYIFDIQKLDSNIYIATAESGLISFNPNSRNPKSYVISQDRNNYCFLLDNLDRIWIGTDQGLRIYDKNKNTIKDFPILFPDANILASSHVHGLCMDKHGNILATIGNDADRLPFVIKINSLSLSQSFYYSQANNNFSIIDEIRNIVCDSNNQIYVASLSGLLSWDADDADPEFKYYNTNNGLLNDQINKICLDSAQNLWCASLNGLTLFLPQQNAFRTYNTASGLLSDEIRHLAFSGGKIFLGYWGQLQYTDLNKLNLNQTYPQVEISECAVNGKNYFNKSNIVKNGDHLYLAYDENTIDILISALSYTNTNLVIFQYKLEGFDKQWINKNDGRIRYSLSSGDFILKYTACNSNGVYNPRIHQLFIHIATPFWKSWWFGLSILSCIIGAIIFYFKQKEKELLKLENLRLNIARDLHDDMGSNLSTIKILSELEVLKNPTDKNSVYHKISEKAKLVMDNMSDIVWNINPNHDELEGIILKIQEYAIDRLEPLDIELKFIMPDINSKMKLDLDKRRHYYLICKEAINNIAKYAQANKVSILIEYNNKSLITVIQDNGVGFHEVPLGTGNGLINMKQRIKLCNGKINIESHRNKGTKIDLVFPVTS